MIVGRIISTFLLATIMTMVVGVFGGFNVQHAELRILGAPPLAASRGSELCAHWRKESSHVLGL